MLSSSSVPHTIWSSSLEIVPQTMFSPREYSSKAFTALAVSAGGATNELRWLRFGVLSYRFTRAITQRASLQIRAGLSYSKDRSVSSAIGKVLSRSF